MIAPEPLHPRAQAFMDATDALMDVLHHLHQIAGAHWYHAHPKAHPSATTELRVHNAAPRATHLGLEGTHQPGVRIACADRWIDLEASHHATIQALSQLSKLRADADARAQQAAQALLDLPGLCGGASLRINLYPTLSTKTAKVSIRIHSKPLRPFAVTWHTLRPHLRAFLHAAAHIETVPDAYWAICALAPFPQDAHGAGMGHVVAAGSPADAVRTQRLMEQVSTHAPIIVPDAGVFEAFHAGRLAPINPLP